MLIICEDCVLGTLFTLVPIIGYRTYTECINKDIPLFLIPLFVIIEILGQSSRILSLALRMAANTTAGHTLVIILLSYMYMFILYTVGLKFQLSTFLLIVFCSIFLCLDLFISAIQSYIIIILEAYYELDSE
jgi:F0F1-type ATP synthase membrane subunit a